MVKSTLRKAKKNKKDEFYTQWSDIEKEVNAYIEYNPNVFRNKTILLPADDPFESNFFKYFATKFNEYGIKKLIATSYAPSPIVNTQLSLIPELVDEDRKVFPNKKAYKIEISEVHDENNNNSVNIDDVITRLKKEKTLVDSGKNSDILSYLDGDKNPDGVSSFGPGDFRSKEVTNLRDKADVIITNPPFSLFRTFLKWINPKKKNFLIIGNINAITYKDVFPLIKDNIIWLGTGMGRWISGFIVPYNYNLFGSEARVEDGNRIVSTNNALWLTNLDHGKRHHPLELMTMEDNLKFSRHKKIKDNGYEHYDNYNAIEVPYTDAIPKDYKGTMGVPITFLDKYNPEQFEILYLGNINSFPVTKKYKNPELHDADSITKNEMISSVLAIKHDKIPDKKYYTADNVNGYLVAPYARILIRRR
ncbi:adenine-specific methyltransferase EcoRI family protein [Apilactobacillus timberlakei]|uniref:DNA methyltransferase n=1 Tax=Apilactobacillus timberlakei TaxID=2008380 RepID=A0ABY2YR21_9LACO|nr:adenine-specific methyltransferase EcoRI family protein [Apilactobacillus timberlakei]TPR12295.1 DNA methyltransferase [Apilactobacillus timberlakei]TPR12817.1 DNA methyltransferase [Apilactobacillus timberlakei]